MDIALRSLERAAALGGPQAQEALLRKRISLGLISPDSLKLAALLGHEIVRDATDWSPPGCVRCLGYQCGSPYDICYDCDLDELALGISSHFSSIGEFSVSMNGIPVWGLKCRWWMSFVAFSVARSIADKLWGELHGSAFPLFLGLPATSSWEVEDALCRLKVWLLDCTESGDVPILLPESDGSSSRSFWLTGALMLTRRARYDSILVRTLRSAGLVTDQDFVRRAILEKVVPQILNPRKDLHLKTGGSRWVRK